MPTFAIFRQTFGFIFWKLHGLFSAIRIEDHCAVVNLQRACASWPQSDSELQTLLAAVAPAVARILPENLALEFGALACAQEGNELTVAVSQTPSDALITRIERATGLRASIKVVAAHLLTPEIARCYGTVQIRNTAAFEEREEQNLSQYLDQLLERAILARASDIHLDLVPDKTRIRFRIDGHLKVVDNLDASAATRLISRIKLLAGLDIAERRLPQDGHLSFPFEARSIDVRVATIPSEAGERVALRLLDRQSGNQQLEQLDFSPHILSSLQQICLARGGFFLICGPTGSGKSTTLYALLHALCREELHLCTVEDPVEKIVPGITQVGINPKSGLTFAVALRALLRQDPDVLMVGEIRDQETATTALGAALSGQLVFSTVHGADIVSGIARLCELGQTENLILQALTGIMSQRLVRRLCRSCRRSTNVSPDDAQRYGFNRDATVFAAVGCERCHHTGYRGRVAIADIALFASNQSTAKRRANLPRHNYAGLLDDARRHCLAGDTCIAEIASLFQTEASSSDAR